MNEEAFISSSRVMKVTLKGQELTSGDIVPTGSDLTVSLTGIQCKSLFAFTLPHLLLLLLLLSRQKKELYSISFYYPTHTSGSGGQVVFEVFPSSIATFDSGGCEGRRFAGTNPKSVNLHVKFTTGNPNFITQTCHNNLTRNCTPRWY